MWVSFRGPIAGLEDTGYSWKKGWFGLYGTNDFGGILKGDGTGKGPQGSGLKLGVSASYPAGNTNGVDLTEGDLVLFGNDGEDYALPRVDFTGNCTLRISNDVKAVVGQVVKKGAGTLALEPGARKLTVTGALEVAGGAVVLTDTGYSHYPSWFKSTIVFPTKWDNEEDPVTHTNCVQGGSSYWNSSSIPEGPMPSYGDDIFTPGREIWGGYRTAVYQGYIWNRAETNVTWTFLSCFRGRNKLFIDDMSTPLFNQSSWQQAQSRNYTLTPGPHPIMLRIYCDNSAGGPPEMQTLNGEPCLWPESYGRTNNFSVVYDPHGRNSTNACDYVQLRDPGDGSLLTASTEASLSGLVPVTRPVISNLVLHAGTRIDLGDPPLLFPYALPSLTGAGTVTNGVLEITARWTLLAAEQPQALTVASSTLTFGEEAVLDVDLVQAMPRQAGTFTVATASAGIVGMPALSDGMRQGKWHLRKTADGKSLMLEYRAGTVLLLR